MTTMRDLQDWMWKHSIEEGPDITYAEALDAINHFEAKSGIDIMLRQASELAIQEVERIARRILKQNRNLIEFVMAMGCWCFWTNEEPLDNEDSRFKELAEFMAEYNDKLKLTGTPMRFTATGPVETNW